MLLKQNDVFKSSNPALSGSELWVVTATTLTGGGEGKLVVSSWPDGHRVDAEAITSAGNPTGEVVSFYQTGSFRRLILPMDIEVVGVATRQYCYAVAKIPKPTSIDETPTPEVEKAEDGVVPAYDYWNGCPGTVAKVDRPPIRRL